MDSDFEYDDDYLDDDDCIDDADTASEIAHRVEDVDDSNGANKQTYTILTEADLQRLQEKDVNKVSNTLCISNSESCILLCYYNCDVNRVVDEWFSDENSVCRAVGLMESPVVAPPAELLKCGICFELRQSKATSAASCGHRFCNACWSCYISTSISNGPGCLLLRCPEPSCSAAVDREMVRLLASDEYEKYSRHLLRFFVEKTKNVKWCPGPGCDLAVSFAGDNADYDIFCKCRHNFCWNCTEDAHRPVDCATVAKWMEKNSNEAENTSWILAYTKPCPKCRHNIEKNAGCNHMTCRAPCGFQFCWLCLEPWSSHRSCNRFEMDEPEKKKEMARRRIEKYTHYFERWAANQSSRQKALADLRSMQEGDLERLSNKQTVTMAQLKFVMDAWEQIVECRRVLKWTYAYGYYLSEEEEKGKKEFFEYLQGEAEAGLERLHGCAETELRVHFEWQTSSEEFQKFRAKLMDLTAVTRKYFENFVGALENGLQDVRNLG